MWASKGRADRWVWKCSEEADWVKGIVVENDLDWQDTHWRHRDVMLTHWKSSMKRQKQTGLLTILSKMIIWQGLDGSAGPFAQQLMRLMTNRWFDEKEEEAPAPPQRESQLWLPNTSREQNITGQRPKNIFFCKLKMIPKSNTVQCKWQKAVSCHLNHCFKWL